MREEGGMTRRAPGTDIDKDRIHRAISDDGTEIAARVHGQGPPLVLVHGSLEDGDLDWASILPFLSERFTCYLMSTRSRGLSGESADLSPQRRLEDVTAFVESVGEPVGLVGESDGGALALSAAARTDAVSAVAVYEPVVFEVVDEETAARMEDTFPRIGEAATEGRLDDAARIFSELVANDDELAALSASGYFKECARYIPTLLQELELEQDAQSERPGLTDPSVLAKITVPVLLLHGSRTALRNFFTDGVRHVADHVANPHVREIAGAGHFAVALAPEPIADELVRFLEAALQRA